MRLRRRSAPTVELEQAPDPATPEQEAAELRAFLLARLRALPDEYRIPLVLRDLEGLSNQEVADVLGISLSAAKSRIHRARMQIRVELEEWETGGASE